MNREDITRLRLLPIDEKNLAIMFAKTEKTAVKYIEYINSKKAECCIHCINCISPFPPYYSCKIDGYKIGSVFNSFLITCDRWEPSLDLLNHREASPKRLLWILMRLAKDRFPMMFPLIDEEYYQKEHFQKAESQSS